MTADTAELRTGRPARTRNATSPWLHAVIACGLVFTSATVGSVATMPNIPTWYAQIAKPSFTPPNWVFGPGWTVLYVMIGVAGWLVWTSGRSTAAVRLWWLQLALNFLWSPVFFAMHRVGLALIVISLLCGAIWMFVAVTARQCPRAALLFVPYGLWVAFATVLNASLYLLNGAG